MEPVILPRGHLMSTRLLGRSCRSASRDDSLRSASPRFMRPRFSAVLAETLQAGSTS